MTAELAIMNKRGIVLSADSAATIGSKKKISIGIQKIFPISNSPAICLMIYGNSEYMGVPLDVIIEGLKVEQLHKDCLTVEHFTMKLLSYLSCFSQCQEYENEYIRFYSKFILDEIIKEWKQKSNDNTNELPQDIDLLNKIIEKLLNNTYTNKMLLNLPKNHKKYIITNYGTAIKKIVTQKFKTYLLSTELKMKIFDVVTTYFCTEAFKYKYTGVVIAGYGTKSTFPELMSLELEGSINGFIKYRTIERVAINNSRSFAAVPFAQSDAILSVFNGVSPKYRERLGDIIENTTMEMDKNTDTHNSSSSILFQSTLLNDIDTFSINEYRNPILEHGSSFRLHELVEISEFLLKFACFRSKYSNSDDLSTVSEPINIASITKFSGVKWETL